MRAEVISLGDARSYYLSTAKNELGVVYATSIAGEPLTRPEATREVFKAGFACEHVCVCVCVCVCNCEG